MVTFPWHRAAGIACSKVVVAEVKEKYQLPSRWLQGMSVQLEWPSTKHEALKNQLQLE